MSLTTLWIPRRSLDESELVPTSINQSRDSPSMRGESAALGESKGFPQKLLNIGFGFALLLAATCLVMGAVYLYTFLRGTNSAVDQLLANPNPVSRDALYVAVNGRLVLARVTLASCGVFVAMSFGFLGFCLFLIGVKEEMNVNARSEMNSVKIARMAQGIFVILCATVLIAVCVTRQTQFSYETREYDVDPKGGPSTTSSNPGEPDGLTALTAAPKKPSNKPTVRKHNRPLVLGSGDSNAAVPLPKITPDNGTPTSSKNGASN